MNIDSYTIIVIEMKTHLLSELHTNVSKTHILMIQESSENPFLSVLPLVPHDPVPLRVP